MAIFDFSVFGPGAAIAVVSPAASGLAGPDFGSDFKSYPDMTVEPITGPRLVIEALYRRFSTERGSNPFHPDDGLDLRSFLNDDFSPDQLFALQNAIQREAEKDERVLEVGVALDFNSNTSALTVEISATCAEGPFRMTMVVSSLTSELLFEEG